MYRHDIYPLAIIGLSLVLGGCAPVIVGGVAGSTAVAHDTRTFGTQIEDEVIENKINARIFEDRELYERSHVSPTSYDNLVLLTGEAPTEELRQRIEALARRTKKVRDVYNEIAVREPTALSVRSNDAWITTKVKGQTLRIKAFDPTRVKVVTERGIVYLMGMLTRKEGDAVAELVRRVEGVQQVVKLFEYTDGAEPGR
ncbi:MAG: BON domain-containing protein [Gammaproteobacteria bacterium]